MRKLYLIFFVMLAPLHIHCEQSEVNEEVVIFDTENGDDFLALFDDIPNNEIPRSRELPWYLNKVARPGVYLLIKVFDFIDWLKDKKNRLCRALSYGLYHLRLKRELPAQKRSEIITDHNFNFVEEWDDHET